MSYSLDGFQNYGDPVNVVADGATMREILSRQGLDIFAEVLADHFGKCNQRFLFTSDELLRAKDRFIADFTELLDERV
jgi:hypothetical protein